MAMKIFGPRSGCKRGLQGKMAVIRQFEKLTLLNLHSGKGWVQLLSNFHFTQISHLDNEIVM
jgi:hypothetical protein